MRNTVFIVLCCVAFLAPLPLGSNRPVSLGMLVFVLGVLGLLMAVRGLARGGIFRGGRHYASWLLGLALLSIVWQLLQLVPLPELAGRFLAQESMQIYTILASTGTDVLPRISVDIDSGFRQLLLMATGILGFAVMIAVVRSNRMLTLAYSLLILACVFQAALGLGLVLFDEIIVPGELVDGHFSRARGSFVNPNHFAAFVNIGAGLLVGAFIAMAPVVDSRGSISRQGGERTMELLVYVLAVLCVVALLASQSRGGIAGLALTVMALPLVLRLARRPRLEQRRAQILLAGVVVLIVVTLLSPFGSRILEVSTASERFWMWKIALDAFAAQPVTGFGAGSFRWLPDYFADRIPREAVFDQSHNLYVELLAEQGLVGFLLLLAYVGLAWKALTTGLKGQLSTLRTGMVIGSLCAGIALLAHAVVDFHMDIPAVFLLANLVLAVGVVAADTRWSGEAMGHWRTHT